jgi:drug/metabolite transporter (DMT)-like permease
VRHKVSADAARRIDIPLALAATVTLMLWASAFPGIRAGLVGYRPGHLVLLRFLVASLVLLMIALFARVRLPQLRHLPHLAILGLVGIAAYNIALSYGETQVASGAASLLVNTAPIFTALLAALFLGERLRYWGWLGLLVSFTGAALIALTSRRGLSPSPWAMLVLLAAFLQATYFILQKPLFTQYRPLELTCYAIWDGTLMSLVFLPGFATAVRAAPLDATLAAVYLGVFPAALAYLAWAFVLFRLPASRAGSLLYAVPVLAFVIAWGWLREIPSASTVLGGVLALGGVVLVNTLGRDR